MDTLVQIENLKAVAEKVSGIINMIGIIIID
jgi:hypothetical protein